MSSLPFSSDNVAYLTLARDFLPGFSLHLPAWGHVDKGIILPPLYPLLIALGSPFTDEPFALAERISGMSLILAGIPLYFLVRTRTSRLVATCSVIAIQLNYQYFTFAFSGLTEPLFLLRGGQAFDTRIYAAVSLDVFWRLGKEEPPEELFFNSFLVGMWRPRIGSLAAA